MEKALKKVYYDVKHPASFSSLPKLHKFFKGKLSKKFIKNWLSKQETYTLHRYTRRNFDRNRYFVSNIDDLWEIDLCDMRSISQHNDGVNYLVIIIDVFSKYTWVAALKSKRAEVVMIAINSIITKSGRKPQAIRSDKGGEFNNKFFKEYCKKNNIKYSTTQNDVKCAVVERVIRTIKTKMWKYLTSKNSKRYIDILQNLLKGYNNTVHSTTNKAPIRVNDKNVLEVWKYTYKDLPRDSFFSNNISYKIGDTVRISKEKGRFDKGYYTNWSREVFKISAIIRRIPVVYKLTDLQGEPIIGTFYAPELQKVTIGSKTLHKINKILRHRRTRGTHEVLVSWRGYPAKFNSWIPYKNLKRI
jgi:hypothetical protein